MGKIRLMKFSSESPATTEQCVPIVLYLVPERFSTKLLRLDIYNFTPWFPVPYMVVLLEVVKFFWNW
jgi:hypothetical protein